MSDLTSHLTVAVAAAAAAADSDTEPPAVAGAANLLRKESRDLYSRYRAAQRKRVCQDQKGFAVTRMTRDLKTSDGGGAAADADADADAVGLVEIDLDI